MDDLRAEMAREAARLMCEQGIEDFALAKTKAAEILAAPRGSAPSNLEVADAVASHLRVFDAEAAGQRLMRMRQAALQAMTLCREFRPKVAGAVVSGLATPRAKVQIHVFCPFDEALDLFLGERNIPFDSGERRFRHPDGRELRQPTCAFMAGDVEIEFVVFDQDDIRWAPLSAIDGKPMQRWSLKELQGLIAGQEKAASA